VLTRQEAKTYCSIADGQLHTNNRPVSAQEPIGVQRPCCPDEPVQCWDDVLSLISPYEACGIVTTNAQDIYAVPLDDNHKVMKILAKDLFRRLLCAFLEEIREAHQIEHPNDTPAMAVLLLITGIRCLIPGCLALQKPDSL